MVSKAPSTRAIGAALGISHTAVRKLHEKQQMPLDSIEAARAWYQLNGHHRGGARKVETSAETSAPAFQGATVSTPAAASHLLDQGTLNRMLTAARVKVTELEASQARMDADLRDGKLLRAEDEYRKNFERAVTLRTKFLSLPAEWAIQLAAMSDPALVADFTRKQIKAALTEYCAAYGVTAES